MRWSLFCETYHERGPHPTIAILIPRSMIPREQPNWLQRVLNIARVTGYSGLGRVLATVGVEHLAPMPHGDNAKSILTPSL